MQVVSSLYLTRHAHAATYVSFALTSVQKNLLGVRAWPDAAAGDGWLNLLCSAKTLGGCGFIQEKIK